MLWDIFLAYSSLDTNLANSLYDCLCDKYHVFCSETTNSKVDFEVNTVHTQSMSRITVVLITNNIEESYYQRKDIETALLFSCEERNKYRVVLIFFDVDSDNRFHIFYVLPPQANVIAISVNNLSEVTKELITVVDYLKQMMTLKHSTQIKHFYLLKRAETHILAARNEEAIRDAAEVLGVNPCDTIALSIQLVAFSRINQQENSISCAKQILQVENDKTSSSSLSLQAIAHLTLNQHNEAILAATNAIIYDPHNLLALISRAAANLRTQQYMSAIKDATQALEIEKWNTRALSIRASAYEGLKYHKEAINDLNKVLDLAPKYWLALETRAYAHYGLKQIDAALADLDSVLTIAPWHSFALKYKAAIYLEYNICDKAIVTIKAYLNTEAHDTDGWGLLEESCKRLGEYYRKHGQFVEAESYINCALSINPTSQELKKILKKILLKEKS